MVVLLACLNQKIFMLAYEKNNHALHDKLLTLNHSKHKMPIDTADKLQLSFIFLLFFMFLKCTTTFEI